jgi:type III pantothenate kinase
MLLAIDVGNTNIHFGLHDGEDWCCTWRARTIQEKMSDEYAVLLRSFFAQRGYDTGQVSAVALASVVPDLTETFVEVCERHLGQPPLNIDAETDAGFKILLDNPHELGPDRLVNAAAVRAAYTSPAIVIDLGTATTFDVLNADGDYIGGAIAPGIGLTHDALVSRAARLHKIDLKPPPSAIGHNTIHAMQSGIFLGYVAMVEGLVKHIKTELDSPHVTVIATGGLAPTIAKHTTVIQQLAPNLTLEGMRIIWERNRR